jgi:DNA polymerase-3 subunit epsilon
MPPLAKVLAPQLSKDLLTYYRRVSQSTLTIVDLETTGTITYRSRAVEVAVLQANLQDGIVYQQCDLINPGVPVPKLITDFTGITQAMVDGAAPAATVWPQYLAKLQQGILTAHNIHFDYRLIRAEYERLGQPFERDPAEQCCTVLLSRLLLADLPSRSLPNLVAHFGFDVGTSHRAGADTLACWLLAQRLLHQIQQEDDEALIACFGRQWMRLKDAARLLDYPKPVAMELLDNAGAERRPSLRSGMPRYRRRDVEQVYWEHHGQQLSLI